MPDDKAHKVPEDGIEVVLKALLAQMQRDEKGDSISMYELISKEFQITNEATQKKLDDLSTDMKRLSSTLSDKYLSKEAHDAWKETIRGRLKGMDQKIEKKADNELVDNRLDRIEKILWLGASTAGVTLLVALINLVVQS